MIEMNANERFDRAKKEESGNDESKKKDEMIPKIRRKIPFQLCSRIFP
jgi:hypothetical protein